MKIHNNSSGLNYLAGGKFILHVHKFRVLMLFCGPELATRGIRR